MAKSHVSILLGLGMEAVGQGFPVFWPNMPKALALVLLVGGLILIVAGIALWLWPKAQKRLPTPLWLWSPLWKCLYWQKYKPRIAPTGAIKPHYKVHEGRAAVCQARMRLEIENRCPDSPLYINHNDARLVVVQRRMDGPRRKYFFVPDVFANRDYRSGVVGWEDVYWKWENEGQPEGRGPNLDASFEWSIFGLMAELRDAPRPVIHELPVVSGEKIGAKD